MFIEAKIISFKARLPAVFRKVLNINRRHMQKERRLYVFVTARSFSVYHLILHYKYIKVGTDDWVTRP